MINGSFKTLALAGGIAFAVAGLAAQSPLGQLKLSEKDAQARVLDSVIGGHAVVGMTGQVFAALPVASRVAVVEGGFAWMKTYVNSPAFKSAYAERRTDAKPQPPQFEGTVADELKRQQDTQAKQMAESRKALAALPADQRKSLEEVITQTEAQMKSPDMVKMMHDGIEMQRKSEQENFQAATKDWERQYPVNGQVLVARGLQTFLKTSADVDFGAQLVARNGKQQFAKPEYESKPAEWKMCFRAGKEAVTAARTAATAWLKELPQQ